MTLVFTFSTGTNHSQQEGEVVIFGLFCFVIKKEITHTVVNNLLLEGSFFLSIILSIHLNADSHFFCFLGTRWVNDQGWSVRTGFEN